MPITRRSVLTTGAAAATLATTRPGLATAAPPTAPVPGL